MKYTHLLDLLTGRPQLALPSYLHTVASVLRNHGASITLPDLDDRAYNATIKPLKHMSIVHSMSQISALLMVDDEEAGIEEQENPNGSLAVIPIMGALSQRQGSLASDSSVSRGYNAIKNDFYMAMQDDSVGGVSLSIDGPGGAQAGNSELVRWMHDTKQQFNKPVWGLVDESAYSASYNIAAVCDRLVTTRSGGVGSIGCVMAHCDQSQANEKQGFDITYIYSGDRKADGNPNQPLSEAARADAQKACDFYASVFREDVSRHRPNLTTDQIEAMQAGTFVGAEAMEQGLVDALQSPDDYYQELFELINRADEPPIVSQPTATEPQQERESQMSKAVEGSGDGVDQHDRYKAICMHPAAKDRMELALSYADSELPTDAVLGMLNELEKADNAVLEAKNQKDEPAPVTDGLSDNIKKMLNIGDDANLTPAQTSILNILAPALGSPDVPADTNDPLDPEQIKSDKPDPNSVDDLVADYGNLYGVK